MGYYLQLLNDLNTGIFIHILYNTINIIIILYSSKYGGINETCDENKINYPCWDNISCPLETQDDYYIGSRKIRYMKRKYIKPEIIPFEIRHIINKWDNRKDLQNIH